jgi:hypothetical protein
VVLVAAVCKERPSNLRSILEPYPPDGDAKRWWNRLKAALGTTSSDFVNATLVQIQNASRMPSGGISEISVNAVLALIEAAVPNNEMEAALAIQMACTHAVAMAVLSRAGGAYGGDRHVALMAAASAWLLRAFGTQVEAAPSPQRRYAGHSRRKDRGFVSRTSDHRQYQPAAA